MAINVLVAGEAGYSHTAVLPPALPVARPAPSRERVKLNGVLIDRVSLSEATERIREFALSNLPHQVVTVNLDFLTLAERHPAFLETINHADLAVADGMPLVWASYLNGRPLAERVAGVELVDAACALAVELRRSVYLLGAAPGVAEAAADTLRARFAGLEVAGVCSPPFGPLAESENAAIVRRIREAQPGFLFVALGAPRQDLWIRANLHELHVPVAIGVGCVLDLLAGRAQRAPRWMQQAGFEWAFRLIQEPRRLWRRYADDLPTFTRLMVQALSGEAMPTAGSLADAGWQS